MSDHFPEPPSSLVEALSAARRPILTSHLLPDGDALGSELALARALAALGAQPLVLNSDPVPAALQFLDGEGLAQVVPADSAQSVVREQGAGADLLVVLDTCETQRLGRLRDVALEWKKELWVIDHHVAGDLAGRARLWSVPSAPATGILVLSLVERLLSPPLLEKVKSRLADPLFVAIAADTGWFGNAAAAAPAAFHGAARLVEWGAQPESLRRRVHDSATIERLRLQGEVLAQLGQAVNGRVVFGEVSEEQRRRHRIALVELDGLVDALRAVGGAEVLVLLVELAAGQYKVSLRGLGTRRVLEIAQSFGGGGHPQAAGFQTAGGRAHVLGSVLSRIEVELLSEAGISRGR